MNWNNNNNNNGGPWGSGGKNPWSGGSSNNRDIEESIKFAEDSLDPTPDELYKDVYKQEDYPFIKENKD